MTRSVLTPTTETLSLQRAQSLLVALDAGTVLRVAAGSVRLQEPMRWLGECMTTPVVTLSEGEAHCVTRGGWVLIEALHGEALLSQQAPLPSWQAVVAALERGLRRWAGVQRIAPLR